jgi:UDP-N-acetylmuramoylalanine--D-glutamate ligase
VKPGIDLKGKRLLVVGLARTGVAVSLFARINGAIVTATDEKPESALAETPAKLRTAGVALELNGHIPETFLRQDLIVVSPGVPSNLPELEAARAAKIPVWSEIELAWRLLKGKLIAITGSNGKTTTTSLIGHIFKTAGVPTLIGGNIGVPLISLADYSTDASVTIAEVSSFQLEMIVAFRPDIGVLLNLSPDHLDRHASFAAYVAAKMRLFENQRGGDLAVLNADDPEVSRRTPQHQRVFWFSRQKRLVAGAFLRDDKIVFRIDGSETVLARRDEITLLGDHNIENVLAACATAYVAGVAPAAIAAGVRTFAGVEHRLEFVAEAGSVRFYNDSKATNVDAALKAIESFSEPLIVILGGTDKGSPYMPLREPLRRRARLAILIGAAAEKIAADLGDAVPMMRAGTLDNAVQIAIERARPGDTVLLAPACSSFDQFDNYEHRGRVFKELVAQLENRATAQNG